VDAQITRRHGRSAVQRRAIGRIEATWLGLDIRFVVTNLDHGSPEWLYDSVYCARGQAENLNLKRLLSLLRRGNTTDTFMRDTLAPLVVAPKPPKSASSAIRISAARNLQI